MSVCSSASLRSVLPRTEAKVPGSFARVLGRTDFGVYASTFTLVLKLLRSAQQRKHMPDACEGIAVLEIAYATIMLEMFLSTNTTNKNQKKQ